MVSNARDLTWLSEAYLLAGRTAEAVQTVQQALHLLRAQKQRGIEADALRILAEIHLADGPLDVERSEVAYRETLALAEPRGMRPLIAHCHLGLGKLFGRTRKREEAREHLTTATTMYREMDMRFWLERAEAEMRELG